MRVLGRGWVDETGAGAGGTRRWSWGDGGEVADRSPLSGFNSLGTCCLRLCTRTSRHAFVDLENRHSHLLQSTETVGAYWPERLSLVPQRRAYSLFHNTTTASVNYIVYCVSTRSCGSQLSDWSCVTASFPCSSLVAVRAQSTASAGIHSRAMMSGSAGLRQPCSPYASFLASSISHRRFCCPRCGSETCSASRIVAGAGTVHFPFIS